MKKISFNFHRFIALLKRDYNFHLKKGLVIFGSIMGGLTLLSLLSVLFGSKTASSTSASFFVWVLLIGGPIISSLIYEDRFSKKSVHDFLMLPVSRSELFFIRYLATSVGLIIFLALCSFLASLVLSLFGLFANGTFSLFNPFSKTVLGAIILYLPLHSLFFFGTTYFKGLIWLKTTGVLVIFVFCFSFLTLIFGISSLVPSISSIAKGDGVEYLVQNVIKILDDEEFPLIFKELEKMDDVDDFDSFITDFEMILNKMEFENSELIFSEFVEIIKSFKYIIIFLIVLFWLFYLVWIVLFSLGSWLSIGQAEVSDAI